MKRHPWRVVLPLGEAYLVQLVDQLDRLQLERVKSSPSEESAELQDERLHEERL